ncbi:MAG: hypothetical protein JWO77_1632 [Ilumatobacteraceae bacterium]|nr:hypothetical protein [Ilumatobacteraceae bacterium]
MVARVRERLAARSALIGVVGAVLLLVGGAWYQALVTPPYRFIDEQAHAGYVVAVQHGELPDIDTPIDEESAGYAMKLRLDRAPTRNRDIWVANNPPLTYVLAAGPGAVTAALEIPGGPLLGLRLVNIVAVGAAVALSYLLGRDLAGGDTTVGLVTAGLVASVPHLGFVAALGFNDGVAILGATGVLLWLARACGAGPDTITTRRAVQWLGGWCAVAALTRPMSLLPAIAAAATALGVVWWRRDGRFWWTAAWLALPSVVLAGWFYVLNAIRYGDPTGSSALLDKFLRKPVGSLWSSLTLRAIWEGALRTIATRRMEEPLASDPRWWYTIAFVVVVGGVIGAAVLIGWSAVLRRGGRSTVGNRFLSPYPLPFTAWVAAAAVSLIPVLLTAQHRAGGGAPHPRYLLPMLPVVAAAVALAAVRFLTRWTGLAIIVALAVVTMVQTRRYAQWLSTNLTARVDTQLTLAIGSPLTRLAGLAIAAVGLVLLVASIASSGEQAGRRPAR